jgi:hypothetical protein
MYCVFLQSNPQHLLACRSVPTTVLLPHGRRHRPRGSEGTKKEKNEPKWHSLPQEKRQRKVATMRNVRYVVLSVPLLQ